MSRSALQLTPLPWQSWSEWEEIYELLFATGPYSHDDDRARHRGTLRIASWRARGRVPLAADMTSTLVELGLIDGGGSGARAPEQTLSLAYAMALTRLVNGVVDPMQQRARAASVQRLAQEVDMPASLVDLRHESTHNRLPSLALCRLAAQQAMLWLHEHYWIPQRSSLHSTKQSLLASLKRLAATTGGSSAAWRVGQCAETLAKHLHPSQIPSLLLPMLLDDGFMAPAPAAHGGGARAAGALRGGGGYAEPRCVDLAAEAGSPEGEVLSADKGRTREGGAGGTKERRRTRGGRRQRAEFDAGGNKRQRGGGAEGVDEGVDERGVERGAGGGAGGESGGGARGGAGGEVGSGTGSLKGGRAGGATAAGAGCGAGRRGAASAHERWWVQLLWRLQRLCPHTALGGELLLACVRRMQAEAARENETVSLAPLFSVKRRCERTKPCALLPPPSPLIT